MKRFTIILIAFILTLGAYSTLPSRAQVDNGSTFFMTDDGSFSVLLPDGWFAAPFGDGIAIANREEAVGLAGIELANDQVSIIMEPLTPSQQDDAGIAEDSTLIEALELYTALWANYVGFELSPVDEINFYERPMAYRTGRSDLIESIALMFRLAPDTFGVSVTNALPGVLNDYGKQGMDIINTVRYSLPLTESYAEGSFSFQYPADWYTDEPLDEFVIIANEEAAIDADEFSSGYHAIVVFTPQTLAITETSIVGVAEELGFLLRLDTSVEIEASILTINAREVAVVDISPFGFAENEGGAMAVETDKGLIGLVYVSLQGEAHLIWQTALNILLSVE